MSLRFAVVTGASSGIGKATAEEFAKHHYSVAVLARRKQHLERLVEQLGKEFPRARFLAVPCDISKWKAVSDAAETIAQVFPRVDVLINNAGAYAYHSLEHTPPETLDHLVDVNVRGLMYVTKALLPLLKKGSAAKSPVKIVNVSSIGGLWGFPNMSVYTATKFAVTGFSSALRRELKGENIDVASIHPGPVNTSEEASSAKRGKLVMLPHQIAEQIFALAESRRARFISHPAFSLLNALENFSPEFVDRVLKKIL